MAGPTDTTQQAHRALKVTLGHALPPRNIHVQNALAFATHASKWWNHRRVNHGPHSDYVILVAMALIPTCRSIICMHASTLGAMRSPWATSLAPDDGECL